MIKKYDLKDLTVNVFLTPSCNLRCTGCIAKDFMAEKKPGEVMKLSEISELEALALKGKPHQFNLLGGEPTLHHQFFDIAMALYNTGTPIGVSTNGLWSTYFFQDFKKSYKFPMEWEITFLGNNCYDLSQLSKLKDSFSALRETGSIVSLGAIIDSENFDPRDHLDIAEENGFELRWSMSEPIAGIGRLFGFQDIDTLRKYGQVVKNIVVEADKRGIETWGDIAVPKCAFDDKTLELFRSPRHDVRFVCPPFFDVGPNLDIWRCLPLRPNVVKNLRNYTSFQEAYKSLKSGECHLSSGIFSECYKCDSLNYDCQGGPKIVNILKSKKKSLS